MTQGLKMVPPSLEEGKTLGHYGVPGMKWGKRKASSAASSTTKAAKTTGKATASTVKAGAKAAEKTARFSKQQMEIAVITVGTGAAVGAALVAGPVGGMAVSALTSVARIKVQTSDNLHSEVDEKK